MVKVCDYKYKLIKTYDSCSGIIGKPSEVIALGEKAELEKFMKDNKMKSNNYVDYSYHIVNNSK